MKVTHERERKKERERMRKKKKGPIKSIQTDISTNPKNFTEEREGDRETEWRF